VDVVAVTIALVAFGILIAALRANLLRYGLGGLVAPFAGIKLLDLVIHGVLGA
jgi:high-affinity K+ transport system ATPase subunit B